MRYHQLGRTDLMLSALGFGCGAVGGLLINADRAEMLRVVARAVELGITYFDTASSYGDGASEANLGLVLAELRPAALVGTKVQLRAADLGDIPRAVAASAEASLKRLRRDTLDLFQLHNVIVRERQPERARLGLDELALFAEACTSLQRAGKIRHWGINGLGDSDALLQALALIPAASIQCCYNLLNPSAGEPAPPGFAYQDYRQLIDAAAARQVGVIAIRVLAGGALSGSAARAANAAQRVDPIATGQSFGEDVARAQQFEPLVREGYVGSLAEAAMRFVLGNPQIATTLIGISNLAQLEQAAAAYASGPLPAEALARVRQIWASPPASSGAR